MIAYIDSSVLARAYLRDESGHAQAQTLLADRSIAKYTGPWTRIEVSGALTRAARSGRPVLIKRALSELDADLRHDGGRVKLLSVEDTRVEASALALARTHGLRALDALHVALASIAIPRLADPGEPIGFASRDGDQATVAESLGFVRA